MRLTIPTVVGGLIILSTMRASSGEEAAPGWLTPWLGEYSGSACLRKDPGRKAERKGDRAAGGVWFTRVLESEPISGILVPEPAIADACEQTLRRFRRNGSDEEGPEVVPGRALLSVSYVDGVVWVESLFHGLDGRVRRIAGGPIGLRPAQFEVSAHGVSGGGEGPLATVSLYLGRDDDDFSGHLSFWEKRQSIGPADAQLTRPGSALIDHDFAPQTIVFSFTDLEQARAGN